jgi:hypothetical protein
MRISNLGYHLCLLKFCNILCLCMCACRTNIMKYEVASWSYPSKYVCLVGCAVSTHCLFISWLPVHSLPVKHDSLSAVCCQAVLLCLAYVAISKAWDIKWLLKGCWICGLISHVAESSSHWSYNAVSIDGVFPDFFKDSVASIFDTSLHSRKFEFSVTLVTPQISQPCHSCRFYISYVLVRRVCVMSGQPSCEQCLLLLVLAARGWVCMCVYVFHVPWLSLPCACYLQYWHQIPFLIIVLIFFEL